MNNEKYLLELLEEITFRLYLMEFRSRMSGGSTSYEPCSKDEILCRLKRDSQKEE